MLTRYAPTTSKNFRSKFEKSIEKQKRQICYEQFIADLSFLFLTAHFEFETEILIHCTIIPCEHPQIFSEFFDTFKIDFFCGSIQHCVGAPSGGSILQPQYGRTLRGVWCTLICGLQRRWWNISHTLVKSSMACE